MVIFDHLLHIFGFLGVSMGSLVQFTPVGKQLLITFSSFIARTMVISAVIGDQVLEKNSLRCRLARDVSSTILCARVLDFCPSKGTRRNWFHLSQRICRDKGGFKLEDDLSSYILDIFHKLAKTDEGKKIFHLSYRSPSN